MRVLVVEDDQKTSEFILLGLRQAGFIVDHRANGQNGLELALGERYDAAIIDVMLPGRDGLSLIDELRRQGVGLPVLILSAKRQLDDRVQGLQAGGDDYLVKPFAFVELLARVRALIRRGGNRSAEPERLQAGDLVIDVVSRKVTRGTERVDLQPREFVLLEFFVRNAGRVVSKTMILQQVWDYDFDPKTNVVDVLVCRLRNKLDRDRAMPRIRTVRGVGYVLDIT